MDEQSILQMKRSFEKLNERRVKLIETPEIKDLKKRVLDIRKKSIENLDELIRRASKAFRENGVEFHMASDSNEACEIIFDVVDDQEMVAKSKSNTLSEVGLLDYLQERGIEVLETDLGDRILQLFDLKKPAHPVGPALHLSVSEIAEMVNEKFGLSISDDPFEIMNVIKSEILRGLESCHTGITGANSVAANDGAAVIVHNEGNVTKLSLMDTHIMVFGIDKFVPTVEDAIAVVKLETAYATGTRIPSYINVISGPSKTADIEKMLLRGMYGPERVVAVALDNGRSMIPSECLWCIGCGSCIVSCPVYNAVGNQFGYRGYLGGRGAVMSSFIADEKTALESGLYMCTLCGLCTEECPVSTPTYSLMEEAREKCQKRGVGPETHVNIRNRIRRTGSPISKRKV